MKLLENAIRTYGKVLPGNVLKVGHFLNQQMDVNLITEMGKDIYKHFENCKVDKILTVEASGIGIACLTAQFFHCNVVFAKKSKTSNVDGDVYTAPCYSYTHQTENVLLVPAEYLKAGERVLVVDDFLAHGEAVRACTELVKKAGATLAGVAIAIEKGFQGAGDEFRAAGVDLYSLAIVDKMEGGEIVFRK